MVDTADDLVLDYRSISEENFIFACQASVPLVFTPELLYQLWNNFKQFDYEFAPDVYYKIPHIAVSDLLLSNLCEPVGFEIYQLKREVRKILGEELVTILGKKRRNTIARFLQEYAQIESNFQQRKKLRMIHALTAQSILDPTEMERQIVHQINTAKTDSEKIDLLMLHKNIVPFDFNSDLKTITAPLGNKLNPILVIEEDPNATGVLTVNLPSKLRAGIKKKVVTSNPENSKKKSLAEERIEECIKNSSPTLHLDYCGLTDADFVKGSVLDRELRKCVHLWGLVLSNYGEKNQGLPNHLNFIPDAVSELKNLATFICNGTAENRWGIQDISILNSLPKLQALEVRFNEIKNIDGIAQCTELKTLSLSHNQITSIKPLLPLLERLSDPMEVNSSLVKYTSSAVWIDDNPIIEPPLAIVEKGRTGILEYFGKGAPTKNKLESLVGLVNSDTYGVVIMGYQLDPIFQDSIYFLTVNASFDEFFSDWQVTFPGHQSIFRLHNVLWASSADNLNFTIWEFWPSDRERLKELINHRDARYFSWGKSAPVKSQQVRIAGRPETYVISDTKKGRITYKGSPKELLTLSGSPVLNEDQELIGINTVNNRQASVTSIQAIQLQVKEALTAVQSRNGNALRICILYSSELESEVNDLASNIDRRMRKYWIEQEETYIDLSLISEKQIQSDNNFPAELMQADVLFALPGNPEAVKLYRYLQNVLIELFKSDEEQPGPTVLVFSRNRLQFELRDWMISMHASVSSYILVDDLVEHLDNNLKMISLAKRYQLTRETMPASDERTGVMASISEGMNTKADGITAHLNAYMYSLSPGKRLAAITALEAQPNPKHLLWLAGCVGDSETPFVGFRAAVALSAALGRENVEDNVLKDAIETAWANLKLSESRDSNQVNTLLSLRRQVSSRIKPIKSEVSMFAGSWSGVYSLQDGDTKWDLELILQENNKLIGVIRDHGPLGKADIHGGIFPDRNYILFSKKYRQRDLNYYHVEYAGAWKTPGFITGTWTIYGKTTTTGTFEMRKVDDINIDDNPVNA